MEHEGPPPFLHVHTGTKTFIREVAGFDSLDLAIYSTTYIASYV